MPPPPVVVAIGGPNGAGKTTISKEFLVNAVKITDFVNADAIAAGLSVFDPDRAAFAAGRVMLERLQELAGARSSFAFETTLASRTFAPWLATLITSGYEAHLLYVWLQSSTLAVERVATRVRSGGHDVSEPVVRRRYFRSARNLFDLYLPLAATWRIYDNSGSQARLIASGERESAPIIASPRLFNLLREAAHADPQA
jgi:predicted ABC-type ATPase